MTIETLTTLAARDASVAEKIAETNARWQRSLYDAAGGSRCSWRQHMRGATAGIYGYLNHLADRDSERFAFCRAKKLRTAGIPYSLQDHRDSYTGRTVRDVVAMLVRNEIIVPTRRFRFGETRKGWIVRKHEAWTIEACGCQLFVSAEIYAQYQLEWEPAANLHSSERTAFWREKRHIEAQDILRRVKEKRAQFTRS